MPGLEEDQEFLNSSVVSGVFPCLSQVWGQVSMAWVGTQLGTLRRYFGTARAMPVLTS